MEDATFLAFPGLDLTVGKTENQVAKTWSCLDER